MRASACFSLFSHSLISSASYRHRLQWKTQTEQQRKVYLPAKHWPLIVICAVWCLSVALVAPYIVILEHKDGVCRESWHNEYHPKMFTVGVFLLFYATTLGVIAPAYACIGCRLHSDDRTMRKFSQQQGPGNRQFQALVRKRSRSNVVIVKTFLFGAVAFAICLLPYHVIWLWHDFGQGGRWTHFEDTLVFANALVYFNSLVNPFI